MPEVQAKRIIEAAELKARELIVSASVEAAKLIKETSESVANIKIMSNDIAYVRSDIQEIKTKLDSSYVTKDTFAPVQRIVYGLVAVLGIATIGAIIKLILK